MAEPISEEYRASRLAEAQNNEALWRAEEFSQRDRAESAEAAAASARETALEEAAVVADETLLGDEAVQDTQEAFDNGMNYTAGSLDTSSAIAEAIRALKSSPQPPTESEVMPDTGQSRQHNATPPASTLAPGADALEPQWEKVIDQSFFVISRYGVSGRSLRDELIALARQAYGLGLTRAQGGKP